MLPIRGALPMAIKAREQGFKGMIVPKANVTEAAIVDGIEVYGAGSLKQVVEFFNNQVQIEPTVVDTRARFDQACNVWDFDFADVKG